MECGHIASQSPPIQLLAAAIATTARMVLDRRVRDSRTAAGNRSECRNEQPHPGVHRIGAAQDLRDWAVPYASSRIGDFQMRRSRPLLLRVALVYYNSYTAGDRLL